MKRRRSSPWRASSQRSGWSPYNRSNSFSGLRRRAFSSSCAQFRANVQVPLRRESGVHHAHVQMRHPRAAAAAPAAIRAAGAVRRRQDRVQRVIAAQPRTAIGHRQKMQIVIAESDRGGIAQGANSAQDFERIGAAIYQIADEPEQSRGRPRISGHRAGCQARRRILAHRRSRTAPSGSLLVTRNGQAGS